MVNEWVWTEVWMRAFERPSTSESLDNFFTLVGLSSRRLSANRLNGSVFFNGPIIDYQVALSQVDYGADRQKFRFVVVRIDSRSRRLPL